MVWGQRRPHFALYATFSHYGSKVNGLIFTSHVITGGNRIALVCVCL